MFLSCRGVECRADVAWPQSQHSSLDLRDITAVQYTEVDFNVIAFGVDSFPPLQNLKISRSCLFVF